MMGTRLDGRGGVASVLRTWQQFGLMERWNVQYIATNGPGGPLRKLWLASLAWLKCAWLISSGQVRLVHVHTSSYSSFWRKSPVFAIALALRRPLIISLHGGAFRVFYAAQGGLGRAWIRLVMRRARYFIVLTNGWKHWIETTEARSRVVVIPNPTPELPDLCVPASALQEATSDGSSAMPLLLFLGRVEQEKGILVLLEALAEARRRGATWQLVCGGTGDIEFARARADALGLSEADVRFVGWIDGETKRGWLQRCDMLVLPSFTENMPMVLLEAFGYAKPVVATSVGGIPDMILDGVDGFLCPPGDSDSLAKILVNALRADVDLKRMGTAGREKADAQYAPAYVIGQIEALYSQLLPVVNE